MTHVRRSFDGGRVVAVRDVSLEIAAGEFLCIVGGSGSGKTTLLRLMNRLIESDSGQIFVHGEDIDEVDPVELRRRTGMVFQSAALFPHMTVAENIAITLRLTGANIEQRNARADELLALMRLEPGHYRNRFPTELSGGERQRVAIARALAAKPSIILMDEPFGALDPLTRDALSEDFRNLHRDLGLTTVLITHDMTEALLLADRIAVMRSGELITQGTPIDLSASTEPYVAELMGTPKRQARRLASLLSGPSS
jgi:osmoprotectant transport system ATP-binding protein